MPQSQCSGANYRYKLVITVLMDFRTGELLLVGLLLNTSPVHSISNKQLSNHKSRSSLDIASQMEQDHNYSQPRDSCNYQIERDRADQPRNQMLDPRNAIQYEYDRQPSNQFQIFRFAIGNSLLFRKHAGANAEPYLSIRARPPRVTGSKGAVSKVPS